MKQLGCGRISSDIVNLRQRLRDEGCRGSNKVAGVWRPVGNDKNMCGSKYSQARGRLPSLMRER